MQTQTTAKRPTIAMPRKEDVSIAYDRVLSASSIICLAQFMAKDLSEGDGSINTLDMTDIARSLKLAFRELSEVSDFFSSLEFQYLKLEESE